VVRHLSAAGPSGEQIEIRHGDQRAVIVEVGGGLRVYENGGRAILDGYGADALCSGGRGQPLIPWPNRTRDGRYEWEGAELQLDLSEPAATNAIHGLTRWRNWSVRERSASLVAMTHALHPSPGYPFTLELELRYELSAEGLSVTASAVNVGDRACPYGIGFHPYLSPPGLERVDECVLELGAATRLLADERGIPHSREGVEGTPYDFRKPRPIGELVMDSCFTDLERDAEGIVRAVLVDPASGAVTTLWLDAAYPFVMVYSGDTLAASERRRGLAVEPMSCAPNALQSGEGLARLEPGATHEARWGISSN
jgi:aldose 1-epimerase